MPSKKEGMLGLMINFNLSHMPLKNGIWENKKSKRKGKMRTCYYNDDDDIVRFCKTSYYAKDFQGSFSKEGYTLIFRNYYNKNEYISLLFPYDYGNSFEVDILRDRKEKDSVFFDELDFETRKYVNTIIDFCTITKATYVNRDSSCSEEINAIFI